MSWIERILREQQALEEPRLQHPDSDKTAQEKLRQIEEKRARELAEKRELAILRANVDFANPVQLLTDINEAFWHGNGSIEEVGKIKRGTQNLTRGRNNIVYGSESYDDSYAGYALMRGNPYDEWQDVSYPDPDNDYYSNYTVNERVKGVKYDGVVIGFRMGKGVYINGFKGVDSTVTGGELGGYGGSFYLPDVTAESKVRMIQYLLVDKTPK